jgi:Leucine Rich repeat
MTAPAWRAELDRVLSEGENQLNFYGETLGDTGAAELAGVLQNGGKTVKRIYFGNCGIGDAGAAAIAELLRDNNGGQEKGEDITGGIDLEVLNLQDNTIGRAGVEALATALKQNTTLQYLWLRGNLGVDPSKEGGSELEAMAAVTSLVAAIGVNTTLEKVSVSLTNMSELQQSIERALADNAGRRRGRERFLSGPMVKAARTND